jgi:hypothetical protein
MSLAGKHLREFQGASRFTFKAISHLFGLRGASERLREENPMTYAELLDIVQYEHKIILSGDSRRHVVRGMPRVKTIIGESCRRSGAD